MTLRQLGEDVVFDSGVRFAHLNTLRRDLELEPFQSPDATHDSSLPTAGLEIEMTWRQAFPDMHHRWLNAANSPHDLDRLSAEYRDFSRQYSQNDKRLKATLEKIRPVIPRVGFDSYWEFSFRPTTDHRVAEAELRTLYDAKVLFEDIPYPTHMTVAGAMSPRDAGAILCILEREGGTTPERLESVARSKKGSWARKGIGGMRERSAGELEGADQSAYEFRTLVTTSPEQMSRLFKLGQEMAHACLHDERAWLAERTRVEAWLKSAGLPITPWAHPNQEEHAEVWRAYAKLLAE